MKKTFYTNFQAKRAFLCYLLFICVLFSSCTKNDLKVIQIKPDGPKPAWGPTIAPQMLAVIEKYESYHVPPLYTLTPEEARKQPTPADAAADVAGDYNITMPYMNVDTAGMDIPVGKDQIHIRIYTPPTAKSSYPVVVYYHGGGWVIATINTYDASCKALSAEADAIVISVGYRRGPEHRFPTAHADSYAAYLWALQNCAMIKGDPKRVAVAGESAGGNLACAVSLMAKENGVKMPVHQLLVYPIANTNLNTPSYIQYANAIPLSKPLMKWFFKNYLSQPSDANNPHIALVSANLNKLPPATIIAAEIDPLQSEGKMLADKLQAAGVPVTYKLYPGVTHEFFGMGAVVPQAKLAEALAAHELRKAFHN